MAHEIDSLFFTGEVPWHGLGKKLGQVATAAEALAGASLDWLVKTKPMFLEDGSEIKDHFAVVREDTNKALGIVGRVYRPLQNKEAFSFFDAVVGEKLAIYHTAGSLRGGEYVWILAKLPGEIRITKDDVVEKFLLLTNTHNGTRAARMLFTPIRVVCMNTHNIALDLADKEARAAQAAGSEITGQAWMRHTKSMGAKVEEARRSLGIVSAQYRIYEAAGRAMAAAELTADAWKHYTVRIGMRPANMTDAALPEQTRTMLGSLSAMFDKGRGNDLPGIRHTAWGAFNAVVEHIDYKKSRKGDDTRAKSILFGGGARLKQKAWDTALAMAGGLR